MVNKAALGVLGVIVLVSMGVGILIGMQLGGPASGKTADGGGNGSNATPLPNNTQTSSRTPFPESPPTANPSNGPGPGDPPGARTTVSYRRFDEKRIAKLIEQKINDRRQQRGLPELITGGDTVRILDRMATEHSTDMADSGLVTHFLDGNTSAGRYRAYGLLSSCTFPNKKQTFIVNAENNNLEVIGATVAGRPYGPEFSKFNNNESAVASTLVERWWSRELGRVSNDDKRRRLSWSNARRIGVGVEVTQDGSVYATVNLCG